MARKRAHGCATCLTASMRRPRGRFLVLLLNRQNCSSPAWYKMMFEEFYGYNRPGAKVSEGVRESFWLQGMMAGIPAAYFCVKAFSETDLTEDLKKFDVPTHDVRRFDQDGPWRRCRGCLRGFRPSEGYFFGQPYRLPGTIPNMFFMLSVTPVQWWVFTLGIETMKSDLGDRFAYRLRMDDIALVPI